MPPKAGKMITRRVVDLRGHPNHMNTGTLSSPTLKNMADVMDRLGNIPLRRIRFCPPPGSATELDVLLVQKKEDVLCELVEGILVEKGMGYAESVLALKIAFFLEAFVHPRKLGLISGPDGTMRLMTGLVRIPDVAFTSVDRLPDRQLPTNPIPNLVPNLAIEVLSASNTAAEMAIKRQEYFAAGVLLVWEVMLEPRSLTIYTAPNKGTKLCEADTLDGGLVLPGFSLPLSQLFAALDL
jgi:Uma2 family endonuclease